MTQQQQPEYWLFNAEQIATIHKALNAAVTPATTKEETQCICHAHRIILDAPCSRPHTPLTAWKIIESVPDKNNIVIIGIKESSDGAFVSREKAAEYLIHEHDIRVEASRTATLALRGECIWSEDEDGVYHTGCGNMFEFISGGLEENRTKFCPYCGKSLQQQAGEQE